MTYNELLSEKENLIVQANDLSKKIAELDKKIELAEGAQAENLLKQVYDIFDQINELGYDVEADTEVGTYLWGYGWTDMFLSKKL